MSRMFSLVAETWNPVTGCLHNCVYCWARRLAETKLRRVPRYREGFKPRLNGQEFKRRFKPNRLVFVSDMGDLFGEWVPDKWIWRVIERIEKFPETKFLFLTKNPKRYWDFGYPDNVILGVTLETNRCDGYDKISKAPEPCVRYHDARLLGVKGNPVMISVEPILDFDLDDFIHVIKMLEPDMVYIGYDNYGHRLPEPPLEKTLRLIQELEKFTTVYRKTIRKAWYEGPLQRIGGHT